MRDIHVFRDLAHEIITGIEPSKEPHIPDKQVPVEHSSSCAQGSSLGGGAALLSCNEESGLLMAMDLGN